MSKLVRAERLERYRRRLHHERRRQLELLEQLEPARPRVANEGCYRVARSVLVANVDPGMTGDVNYADAGYSVQHVLEPVPRHLWPVNRAAALPVALEPVSSSSTSPTSSPAPAPRPRRCRRTHRPARARAPDGPPDPAHSEGPAHHVRAIATTFDQPEVPLRDRISRLPR